MEKEEQKPILTLPQRIKLLWLIIATRRGRSFARALIGAARRAQNGNPLSAEEWEAMALPFIGLLGERGFDVERIKAEFQKSVNSEDEYYQS